MSTCPFKIISVVIAGILLIVLAINAFYFFRLRNGKFLGTFEMNSMYFISVILAIILALYFAYAIYVASKECGVHEKVKQEYATYQKGKQLIKEEKE